MISYFYQNRIAALAIAIASFVIVGSAIASEIFGGLAPCVLCVYQRIPYAITIGLGLVGFFKPQFFVPAMILAALTFQVGGGIGIYHVGVEQAWWTGTEACVGAQNNSASIDELRAQIMATPVIRCNDIQWSLFGISMAGYNVLVSLVLAGFSLLVVRPKKSA